MSQIQTNTWLPIDFEKAKSCERVLFSIGFDIFLAVWYWEHNYWVFYHNYRMIPENKLRNITHYMVPEAPLN